MVALLIVSGYTAINAVVKAELFPTSVRAMGVGFPYAVTVALFGGTAEYVALYLKSIGHEQAFFWYVTGASSSRSWSTPSCATRATTPPCTATFEPQVLGKDRGAFRSLLCPAARVLPP